MTKTGVKTEKQQLTSVKSNCSSRSTTAANHSVRILTSILFMRCIYTKELDMWKYMRLTWTTASQVLQHSTTTYATSTQQIIRCKMIMCKHYVTLKIATSARDLINKQITFSNVPPVPRTNFCSVEACRLACYSTLETVDEWRHSTPASKQAFIKVVAKMAK